VLPSEALFHAQLAPHGPERWASVPSVMDQLKGRAKELGLWNLWLSGGDFQGMAGGEGGGLTNLEVSFDPRFYFASPDALTEQYSTLSWPRSWVIHWSSRRRRQTAQLQTQETWVRPVSWEL
jgi:hypothetical protein